MAKNTFIILGAAIILALAPFEIGFKDKLHRKENNIYTIQENAPIICKEIEEDYDENANYIICKTISVENTNAEENINKINESLNEIQKQFNDANVYEKTTLPKDTEFLKIYEYNQYLEYQSENIFSVSLEYNGYSGGGASNHSVTYMVFDKKTGEQLKIDDITKFPDTLMEYIFSAEVLSEDGEEYTSWKKLADGSFSLTDNLDIFKEYFDGTWTIDEKYFIVSRSNDLSGPVYTLKYSIEDINNYLHDDILEIERIK